MERKGIPTVIIASAGFEHDLEASAAAFGVPHVPYVLVPLVYNNITEKQAATQTEPVVDEITKLLCSGWVPSPANSATQPLDHLERLTFGIDADLQAMETFNRHFLSADWGDGYPLWPPTIERVQALLSGVEGTPEDVVCMVPPGNGLATVRHIAVNAAMAGCSPGDMPVVMAALRALAKMPEQLSRSFLMSTGAHAPLFIINGPLARQLQVNGGRGCLGPGKRNATNLRLGRAILLCLKNLGRLYPGIMDLGTIGTSRKLNYCFAENEAETPWEPLHVTQGFSADESTVTVLIAAGEQDVKIQGHLDAPQLARAIAANISAIPTLAYLNRLTDFTGMTESVEGMLVLVSPPHAQPLQVGGFTKESLSRYLHQHSEIPIRRVVEPLRKLESQGRIKPEYRWMFELPVEEQQSKTFPLTESDAAFTIVVAGSVRGADLVLPTMGKPFTERIVKTPIDPGQRLC